jgi:rhodanese-related sulfurtransferase
MAAHSPAFLALVESARAHVTECTVHDLKARVDVGDVAHGRCVVLDVREESEWAQGHVPGARHIGKGVIERDIEVAVPALDTEILLYCGGGFRSVLAAVNLKAMGYTNIISVDGGMRGWREAGYPVIQPGTSTT